jgi:hypothetical protein
MLFWFPCPVARKAVAPWHFLHVSVPGISPVPEWAALMLVWHPMHFTSSLTVGAVAGTLCWDPR